jgi:DNA-binding NarL/FixJ family response regulator
LQHALRSPPGGFVIDEAASTSALLLPRPRTAHEDTRPAPVALARVLLVSDNGPLRTTWVHGLRGLSQVIEETSTLTDAYDRSREAPLLDLVVVDAGTAAAEAPEHTVTGLAQTARVVVCGLPDGEQDVQLLLRSGARGYLFGGSPRGAGVAGSAEEPAEPLPRKLRVPDVHGVERLLSLREIEIIRYAADGETNIEIARRLRLSPLTVKSHLGRIGRRLGTGDRARLVLLALRAGVIS